MTQPSPISCAAIFVSKTRTMKIPIQLINPSHTINTINTHAIIDSSTEISCIDWEFVQKHQLSTDQLETPIIVHNIDQSTNKNGKILFTTTLFLNIKGITQEATLHVMNCGAENVILGDPWLWKVNLIINWQKQTLTISKSLDESKALHSMFVATCKTNNKLFEWPLPHSQHVDITPEYDEQLFNYLKVECKNKFLIHANENHVLNQIIRCGSCFVPNTVIAKLTHATELAVQVELSKLKPILLPEYTQFTKVFEEPGTGKLPPSCPYDHAINLKESFIPKIGKLYPLSAEEQTATEEFLDKHFKSERIHLFNSLQAAQFFFVKKKDGKLHPCQDYQYLNKDIIQDTYPLPLIGKLINKLKDASVFTKFDVW